MASILSIGISTMDSGDIVILEGLYVLLNWMNNLLRFEGMDVVFKISFIYVGCTSNKIPVNTIGLDDRDIM